MVSCIQKDVNSVVLFSGLSLNQHFLNQLSGLNTFFYGVPQLEQL
jgi:hypothetical protein